MTIIPSPEDVAQVAAMQDLIARNNEVTRGYYLYSQRMRTYFPDEVSWVTLATWASAQAGRTVRKEDMLRTLEWRLGDSDIVRRIVHGPLRLGARYVIGAVLELNPFERSSQAVSRGNIKVYREIGAEFARFLRLVEQRAGEEQINAFIDSLTPGDPPDGQAYLKTAFRAYFDAMQLPAGKDRSELILLGNLSIGVHEQTRLQPEIEESIDGSVWDGLEIKNRLVELLLPHLKGMGRILKSSFIQARLDPYLSPLIEEVQALVRQIVTERLMVLELPGEVLRLGEDLRGEFHPHVQSIQSPVVRDLLLKVDLSADTLAGTGAVNWADFPQRMHFIADLFRSRQFSLRLFELPAE